MSHQTHGIHHHENIRMIDFKMKSEMLIKCKNHFENRYENDGYSEMAHGTLHAVWLRCFMLCCVVSLRCWWTISKWYRVESRVTWLFSCVRWVCVYIHHPFVVFLCEWSNESNCDFDFAPFENGSEVIWLKMSRILSLTLHMLEWPSSATPDQMTAIIFF